MTKAVRITSILVAIVTVVVFASPVFLGANSSKTGDDDSILSSPSVIDKFIKAGGNKSKTKDNHKSPLVEQAEAFALYLNPPPPKKPKIDPKSKSKRHAFATKSKPKEVASKFTIIATSYNATRPEMSFALIDEPGKGFRWVKQSQKVGHLLFDQIKNGSVILNDGNKTFEQQAERVPEKSLLKSAQTAAATLPSAVSTAPAANSSRSGRSKTVNPAADKRKSALMSKFMENLNKDKSADKSDLMDEFIKKLRDPSVDSQEANNLKLLGKKLDRKPMDPNEAKDKSGKLKSKSK